MAEVVGTSRATRADRVFEMLEHSIVTGEIPLGSRLGEEALARHYGISRGPLREALRQLEGRGLVVRHAHAGVRVVSLTREQLVETYEIREMLEGLAARLAAERMSDDEIEELDALLASHLDSFELQADRSYFQASADIDFHYRIALGSKSGRLIQMLCGDLYSLIRMCRFKTSRMPGRQLRAFRDHQRIVEAIRDRDADLGELLMRRHIQAARKRFAAASFDMAAWSAATPAATTSSGESPGGLPPFRPAHSPEPE